MRIGGQQGDGAAARRARSAAKDGAIRLSWLARNGGTPGEESRRRAVAASWPSVSGLLPDRACREARSEEHTSELQSLMRISYAVFCLKKKTNYTTFKLSDRDIGIA